MAAIHDQRNKTMRLSSSSSSSAQDPLSCRCRGVLSEGWEWFLPITRRGHFFQDSFFENARTYFDAAVRDILTRYKEDTSFLRSYHQDNATSDNLSLYRQLRSRDLKEENQAVTVTTDNTSHKIVLDVHEFKEGDIKVKVIAEKEVLVQGSIKAEKNGGSSMTFNRHFLLPQDVCVQDISSVMSSDGVLTITVPRKISLTDKATTKTIFNNQASSHVSQSTSNTTSSSNKENDDSMKANEKERKICENDRYCESCYKKLMSGKKTIEENENKQEKKIPISVNSSFLNGVISESFEKQQSCESIHNEKMNVSSADNSEVTTSSKRGDQLLCSENKKENKCITIKNENGVPSNHITDKTTEKTDTTSCTQIPISMNFRPLPIVRRGLFFNDSIFENARKDFQNAVREVLANWGQQTSILDELSCYRNLRTQDLREENQAVKVSEDERNHKFVLDVQDFQNGGEVNVKAVDDRELVVEGKVERQEGGSQATKRFFKRFVVPHDIILDSVTSVMSSDGVLTITAPKKSPTIEIRDVTSPIRLETVQQSLPLLSQGTNNENCNVTTTESSNSSSLESSESSICQKTQSHQNVASKEHIIPVYVEENIPKLQHANQLSINKKSPAREYIIPVNIEEGKSEAVETHNTSSGVTTAASEKMKDNSRSEKLSLSSNTNGDSSSFSKNNSETNDRDIAITKSKEAKRTKECMESTISKQQTRLGGSVGSSSVVGRLIPMKNRGSFFTDTIFDGSRNNFNTAVKEVLRKFSAENSHVDDITAYRGLRQHCLVEESQAMSLQEDDQNHKVILDVNDFTNGDINISIVGERELVIEGRMEKKSESSADSQSFCRRILLPDSVDVQSITSAISNDGILTVESAKNGSLGSNGARKTSSEAESRRESHDGSGHRWEQKAVKESSEKSDGYSSRCYSTSYKAHQTSTTVF